MIESIPKIISHPFYSQIEDKVGKIDKIEAVSGGLVHHVHKITTLDKNTYYAKIRGVVCSEIPGRETSPSEMILERDGIEIMSHSVPKLFPHIILEDAGNGFILLSDAMPNGYTLIDLFRRDLVDLDIISNIGASIALIHKNTASIETKIHGEREEIFFKEILEFRFGYHENKILNGLINESLQLPKNLIVGGLSPKNILIGKDKRVAVCDLETVCQGNHIFDISFCLGHILAHNITKPNQIKPVAESFTKAYNSVNPIDFDNPILIKMTLATILYRSKNSVIPYNLGLDNENKKILSDHIFELIETKDLTWEYIHQFFTSPLCHNKK